VPEAAEQARCTERQALDGTMSEQMGQSQNRDTDLRGAIQALLDDDLTDRELVSRLHALLPPLAESDAPATTDEATDHPGYQ
jgi:hypothetical protein